MQKQAPSAAKILIAAAFAISCFVLLLFLWTAFGGPVPFKAKSYRITAYFPEAAQLTVESDVRIGGVSVGKVKETGVGPPSERINGNDVTEAVLEIEPQYAPISEDAEAILRQKTLLGETYIELTSGTEPGSGDPTAGVSLGAQGGLTDAEASEIEAIPEDGTLASSQTTEANQIDEFFNALDEEARMSFRRWQASAAVAVRDRGLDLNDALGNLAPFITDTSDLLEVLDRQEEALRGVVRDTGTTFEALSQRGSELTDAIQGGRNTFSALAQEQDALAELFAILPTFQRESRATLIRLDEFQRKATPTIEALMPVAQKLSPTLEDVRRLAPHLRNLFYDLRVLNRVSLKGLPALRSFLLGLAPVIDELEHFLANLNPIIRYLSYQRATVADFLTGPGAAMAGALDGFPSDPARRHYLRQLTITGTETLSIHPNRVDTNRGNGYLADGVLNASGAQGIFPSFDCRNTDYKPFDPSPDTDEEELRFGQTKPDLNENTVTGDPEPPDASYAPCWIQGDFPGGAAFGNGDRGVEIREDP